MPDDTAADGPSGPRLVGMVHLAPLPGAPGFAGDTDAVLERAVADAITLADAGFDAVMVENYGDVPFFPDEVPAVTVAAMARAVATIRAAVDIPIGVNVLRNDGLAALSIAASCGAQFIRVNVLSGAMYTDQGLISGRAAEIARLRASIAPEIEVLADVFVKHAAPPPGLSVEEAAADTYERGLADALIVSGAATGKAPDRRVIEKVRKAVPDAPLLIGSGATRRRIGDLLQLADGVIVGTDLKEQGAVENPVDAKRAAAMVQAASAPAKPPRSQGKADAAEAPGKKQPADKPAKRKKAPARGGSSRGRGSRRS